MAPRFAPCCLKSHAMFLQCIYRVPAQINYKTCESDTNRQYVLLYFSFFVTSQSVHFYQWNGILFLNTCVFTDSNTCSKIQSVSHRAFALQLTSQVQDKQSLHNLPDVNTPKSSGVTSSDSCSQARSSLSNSTSAAQSSESHRRRLFGSLCRKTPGRTGDTDFDAIGQLKEYPHVPLSSTEEVRAVSDYYV